MNLILIKLKFNLINFLNVWKIKDFATTTVKTVVVPKKQSLEDNYDEEYDDDVLDSEDKSEDEDNEVVRDFMISNDNKIFRFQIFHRFHHHRQ